MHDRREIEKLSREINDLTHSNRLKEALIRLSVMMEGMHVADFTLQFENLDQTYRMLLEYTFRNVPDPQRERIYQSLRISVLELADIVKQKALANTGMHIYSLKAQVEKEKEITREEAVQKLNAINFESELDKLLRENEVLSQENKFEIPHITPRLFQTIWLTDKYSDADIRLIQAIRTSSELPWYEKCLAVSAVTISLLNCFDKEKFSALFDFYEDRQNQVWQRALTGLIMGIYYYSNRVELYPSITSRLEACKSEEFYQQVKNVLIQVFKAKETEKLTTRFKEEILPDVRKFESRMKEKLDLDNLLANDMIEDKNPDWELLFEDSPDLLNKIEKLSEMQMDGLDLFMGTFAMLKNFDFFREISNWFRPFYRENEVAQRSISQMEDLKETFLSGMENSFYMCNSDKYSFCFNISHLPQEQGRRIMSLFNMEAENLHEVNEEARILNRPEHESYVFTQYIQDLYRFFKLHPFRNDFTDVFGLSWDITDTELFRLLIPAPDVLKSAAQFLFEKEHFQESIHILRYLVDHESPEQPLIEKLAYCYQLIGDYQSALDYYKKSEIFESNRLWSVKKIIFCYRKLRDDASALKWCLEALLIADDDVYLHTMAGNCYLDLKQYEKALDHYFRVEFLAPDNKKVLRPIAWCCFVLNKPDMAKSYMNTILQSEPTAHDYINAGHIEYCHHNKTKAMDYYRKALSDQLMTFERFNEILDFDKEYLLGNGVNPEEIPMIIDYLRY